MLMNQFRWLLILDDVPDPAQPGGRYRLWLVELDGDQPALPLRCDSLDDLYQALMERRDRPGPLPAQEEE